MKDISFYFSKYKDLGLKQKQIEESLIKSIEDICGFVADKENIKITQKAVSLNIKGVEKNEIFIHKKEVQERFQELLQNLGYKLDNKKIF
jgi:hypothetical protein